jgi:hypothetical protein
MKKEKIKKFGIWMLAIALFAAHLFFRTVAHAEADSGPGWKQMFAKHGECKIDFPAPPQIIEQSFPLADGVSQLKYDVYVSPFEDRGVFLLLIATYPMPLSGGHEVAGLEGLLKGIVGHHPENKLVFADLGDLFGHAAINFLVEGKSTYFRGHALMVGNKLFLIAMEGVKGNLDEPAFTRFLKSFKLSN